jgi:flavin-dependent dehydrogenase
MVYDAIVVGSGPSGAVAAALLAETGLKVLTLEKASHPRTKPCGGCISKKIDGIFDLSPYNAVEMMINEVTFTYLNRERVSYHSPLPWCLHG